MSHLRDTRVKQGLSLRDLANRTGIGPVRLSRLERLKAQSTPEEISSICESLGNPAIQVDEKATIPLSQALVELKLCQHPSTAKGLAFVDGHRDGKPFGYLAETVCCAVCGETLEVLKP